MPSGKEKLSRADLSQRWKWYLDRASHKFNKTSPIFAGKSDIKSAFRILGLSRSSWNWLVMKARDPRTNEWKYFIDKCLPFGASISCALFQRFSDSLCFLIEHKLQVSKRITNYLDDFLFIARMLVRCNFMLQQFLQLCADLGIPVAMEKTEWGTEIIVFLGILLDGRFLTLLIPTEKKDAAVELLMEMMNRKKVMVKDLQKLCGLLNFTDRAVYPGRTFTRQMYMKYSTVVNFGKYPSPANEFKIKQYHHVRVDKEFKLDCQVWLTFLMESFTR